MKAILILDSPLPTFKKRMALVQNSSGVSK
jgi:hypothetical protein